MRYTSWQNTPSSFGLTATILLCALLSTSIIVAEQLVKSSPSVLSIDRLAENKRPKWSMKIVAIKSTGKQWKHKRVFLKQEAVAREDNTLWALSFRAIYKGNVDRCLPRFSADWIEVSYTPGVENTAQNLGYVRDLQTGGMGDPILFDENGSVESHLIFTAPKDLLKRQQIYIRFLDYPTVVVEPKMLTKTLKATR